MRKLEFRDAANGDDLPGNPYTPEGCIAILSWLCPSLSREEAASASDVARERMLPIEVEALRSLIVELYQ